MGHSSPYRYEDLILDLVTADLTPLVPALEQFDTLEGHASWTPASEAAEAQVPVTDPWM